MKHNRLELALDAGMLLALDGPVAVFGQISPERLRGLARDQLRCVSPSFTMNETLKGAGISVSAELETPCAHALVFLPRAKAEAQHLIAKAVQAASGGWVIVDGQKTDGIESIARLIKKTVEVAGSYSKAHGKTIWFRAEEAQALATWHARAEQCADGYVTAPGVFSADGVDPASALLAQHLPEDITGVVADLGSGWGFLSAQLLLRAKGVSAVHLVEDSSVAMACALQNVSDPRGVFHWANALNWTAAQPVDAVIMNPPFHTGREADPALGAAFIQSAARLLRPGGRLFMVANAHLPYDPVLAQAFAKHETLAQTTRFKVTLAEKGRAKHR